ncbi:Trigger factor [bioreactor metagenome]|uniref:Trigger factor n=1 Tax=bioreactor metagenome TaxID=1076179 RepID=A0A645DGY9_9ZZZZ
MTEALDAVTDEQINERIKSYRAMYGNYAEAQGGAQKEDMLKVTYKSDFALPEDASPSLKRQVEAESTFLWLSEPETIPGSIAALTGAEAGREYEVKAEYPADCREAALAGKTVNYTVKVEGVQRRAELTDQELAEKARVKTIEEFRDMLRKAMEQENRSKQRDAVIEKVYAAIDGGIAGFELPPSVLGNEVQKELQKIAREIVKTEEDAEKFKGELEEHKKVAEAAAKKALRRTFILRKLAKAEGITLEENEVDAQLREMSRYYGYKEKEFRSMLEKNGGMDDFQLDILSNKVLNHLADKATK